MIKIPQRASSLAEEQSRESIPVGRAVIMLNLLLAMVVLAKDLLLAAYLGVSWQADAFFLAFFLPDAIGSSVLATTLSTALVPALVATRSAPLVRRMVARRYAIPTCLGSLLLAGFLFWLREPLLTMIAHRQSASIVSFAGTLLALILPIIVLYPLTAVASAVLQARGRFLLPALGPVIQNGVVLAALALLSRTAISLESGIYLTAAALSLAALCALLVIGRGAAKQLVVLAPSSPADLSEPERSDQRLLPWLIIAVSTQLMLLGERFWAGRLGAGVISALNYAYRLAQFPLWTFISALAMVTLPALSLHAAGDGKEMSQLAQESVLLSLLLTIPTGLTLSALAGPIVTLLMQHGNFDSASVLYTSQILTGYALSIAPAAVVLLGQRFFLAKGRLLIPAGSCLFIAGVTFAIDGWLIAVLGSRGLGYGAAIGATFGALLTLYLLKRMGLDLGSFLRSQAAGLLLGHLPFGVTLLASTLAWPLIAQQGQAGRVTWLVASALMLPSSWLLGLDRAHLLQPILSFLGIRRPTRRRLQSSKPN